MSEELYLPTGASKEELYSTILPQIESLISDEPDSIANLANIAAVLKEAFNFFWVGFYLVKGEELVLGPFQGPLACTRIKKGKGVCGSAWRDKKTYVVPDVDQFPGHIACSSLSRSEIVVPIFTANNEVVAILDIDSEHLNTFDSVDQFFLEKLCHDTIFRNIVF
ncbi:GAF domain-containing protein [Bacteroides sp. OttesenSCG-928-D19]|nr:GAF domain-containing protein [Bacteroides sp. OttesenSCG-928-D19]